MNRFQVALLLTLIAIPGVVSPNVASAHPGHGSGEQDITHYIVEPIHTISVILIAAAIWAIYRLAKSRSVKLARQAAAVNS